MAYQTTDEIVRDAERRTREVFTKPNKYGYQLNVSNSELNKLYEAHIKANRIHRPMGDKQRIEWEKAVWNELKKCYRSCYRLQLPNYPEAMSRPLREIIVGWQREQLEDIVNFRLNTQEIITKLYGGKL